LKRKNGRNGGQKGRLSNGCGRNINPGRGSCERSTMDPGNLGGVFRSSSCVYRGFGKNENNCGDQEG